MQADTVGLSLPLRHVTQEKHVPGCFRRRSQLIEGLTFLNVSAPLTRGADEWGALMYRVLAAGAGLVATLVLLGSATAADLTIPKPAVKRAVPARAASRDAGRDRAASDSRPASTGRSWSGTQIGGSNGSSLATNNFVEPGSYICPPTSVRGRDCFETPFDFKEQTGSLAIGPFVGYRLQFGILVVGVEADVSYKSAATMVNITPDVPIQTSNRYLRHDEFTGRMSQGTDGSIRGRVGILVTPWALIYGTAGIAFEHVTGSLSYTGTVYQCGNQGNTCRTLIGVATSGTSFSETRTGTTGGGGVEVQLFGPWTARLEYRFADFGSFTKSFPVHTNCGNNNCNSPSQGATIDLHPSFHTVRFGLGFSF